MSSLKYVAILILITTLACKVNHSRTQSKKIATFDPNKIPLITYLVYDSIQDRRYFNDGTPTEITKQDSIQIEFLLNACITEENKYGELYFDKVQTEHPNSKLNKENFILILSRYKRQYMAILNKNGEKEVWVNCFCDHFDWNLKTRVVQVCDGGNCFFNLKINLNKNIYYNLMINGDA